MRVRLPNSRPTLLCSVTQCSMEHPEIVDIRHTRKSLRGRTESHGVVHLTNLSRCSGRGLPRQLEILKQRVQLSSSGLVGHSFGYVERVVRSDSSES